ncbi:hypothetical protein FB567DRAFT_234570 [Paraphoma chrysanthemicola]|uniref:Uncharacterized protein n=1 Tax=Paraphoma chrysanthemicola TaxID=798071 RepID=A0A8K0RFS0_9PLEO|nr:hypothetical protein FB567DRAFT_234570 [Paraphoma chrysanthemicola]
MALHKLVTLSDYSLPARFISDRICFSLPCCCCSIVLAASTRSLTHHASRHREALKSAQPSHHRCCCQITGPAAVAESSPMSHLPIALSHPPARPRCPGTPRREIAAADRDSLAIDIVSTQPTPPRPLCQRHYVSHRIEIGRSGNDDNNNNNNNNNLGPRDCTVTHLAV